MPQIWLDIWNDRYKENGRCHRKDILEYLGEERSLYPPETVVTKGKCCSACNPALSKTVDKHTARATEKQAPIAVKLRAGGRPASALPFLREWAVQQAEGLFEDNNRLFTMPSNFFMPDLLLSSLCAVFNRVANVDDW